MVRKYLKKRKKKGGGIIRSCPYVPVNGNNMLSALAKYVRNRLIHGLFHIALVISPRAKALGADIKVSCWQQGQYEKGHVLIYNYFDVLVFIWISSQVLGERIVPLFFLNYTVQNVSYPSAIILNLIIPLMTFAILNTSSRFKIIYSIYKCYTVRYDRIWYNCSVV